MTLADNLHRHRSKLLTDLDDAHDYYHTMVHSVRTIQQIVQYGSTFSILNSATGNRLTQDEFPSKTTQYINGNLAVASLQQFVGLFEDFFFGLLRLWLQAHPHKLGRRQISASVIFDSTTLDEVKLAVIDRELNELNYKRVREWFDYLESLVRLGAPTEDEIGQLAEMKATRDIFIHNRGVANSTYEEKAGANKRYRSGELMVIPESYHRACWELVRKVVRNVSDAAIEKA